LLLRVGQSRYALPLEVVAEVLAPLPVTRVPGLPAWACGVANWRGRVLPVIDLREPLGEPRVPCGRPRLVALRLAGVSLGLRADAVDGVIETVPTTLHPAPLRAGEAVGILAGSSVEPDGPLAWLDPEGLLALRNRLPQAAGLLAS
jgi:purine-binding chemotaxis protein CheW